MVHDCGVSQFPQFNDKLLKIKMMTHPNLEVFDNEKGYILLKEPYLLYSEE